MNYIAALIAAIVALISIQQYFLARERFKLDLFEKRFAIFKATEKFLNDVIFDRYISSEKLTKFVNDTQTASYIFDDDIVGFLNDIGVKADKVTYFHNQQKELEGGSPDRMDLGKKKADILEEFIVIQLGLKERFSRYLKFKKWKFGFLTGISN